MNGMTISLVGQNNNIVVTDGLLHGQLGAMVGIISFDKVEVSIMADTSNKLTVSVCDKKKKKNLPHNIR